jgi:hypothetical protein
MSTQICTVLSSVSWSLRNAVRDLLDTQDLQPNHLDLRKQNDFSSSISILQNLKDLSPLQKIRQTSLFWKTSYTDFFDFSLIFSSFINLSQFSLKNHHIFKNSKPNKHPAITFIELSCPIFTFQWFISKQSSTTQAHTPWHLILLDYCSIHFLSHFFPPFLFFSSFSFLLPSNLSLSFSLFLSLLSFLSLFFSFLLRESSIQGNQTKLLWMAAS